MVKRVATATYGKCTSMHHIRVASANLGAKGGKLGSLIVTQWSKFTVGPAWRRSFVTFGSPLPLFLVNHEKNEKRSLSMEVRRSPSSR